MNYDRLIVYVDGASRGNPGPASYGVCVQDKDGNVVSEIGECLGVQTNNFAEYRALERGLQEAVLCRAKEVQVYTDSQLVARQFSGQYKIKNPAAREMMGRIKLLQQKIKKLTVTHILRSTHEGNVRADALANLALDSQNSQDAQDRQNSQKKVFPSKNKIFVQDSFF